MVGSRGRTLLFFTTICTFSLSVTLSHSASAEVPDCNVASQQLTADSGSATIGSNKNWQPLGGEIEFTIKTAKPIPTNAPVRVCFRWKVQDESKAAKFIPAGAVRIVDRQADSIKLGAVIPNELPNAPPFLAGNSASGEKGVRTGLWLVPVAEVRILLFQPDGTVFLDSLTQIGVSRIWWGVVGGIATVALAFILLTIVTWRRLPGLRQANPLLRVVSTAKGYASLSQLQIVLWTFLVGASAVYVMVLSGKLIEITSGTLVLLGISAAATIGSKVQSVREDSKAAAKQPADAVAPLAVAPQPAPQIPPAQIRLPLWSDLVVNEGEIDVTRVQMLYFTIVTAVFVLTNVLASYTIPEIPDGFQTLMGISNGVYVGSKFVQR